MLVVYLLIITTILLDEGVHSISYFEQISQLVTQWAPLIWLSPGEEYYPSSVEHFLENMILTDRDGNFKYSSMNETNFYNINTKSLFLVTKRNLLDELDAKYSFLHGNNPKRLSTPVYALVSFCRNYNSHLSPSKGTDANKQQGNLSFQVTYWVFYPYNRGKDICFLGNVPSPTIFGRCIGRLKTIGSHVGDWEHVTLLFKSNKPSPEMYLSVHDTGGYYKYDEHRRTFKFDQQKTTIKRVQKPKFASTARMQMGHPVLFAANGSHGLWASPGNHEYVKIPRLTDRCGYGVPLKTWENLNIFYLGYDNLPKWMLFKGKWGNPMSNCVLSKKIGLCEHTNGPGGILRKNNEFYYC